MVGVQESIECPQCHFDKAFYEYQTRNDTGYLFCPRCGYTKYSKCLIDRIKQMETGGTCYKKNKDGKLIGRTYEYKGYGSYSIDQGTGVVSNHRFTCGGERRDKVVEGLKALRKRGLTVKIRIVDDDKMAEV